VLPILIRRCRKIIAVSEYTKKRILSVSNIETNKIDVVYNGLSSRFSPQTEREEKRVRKQLGLPSKNYLLSLGTISPRKNTKRLLEAWRQVQRDVGKDYWLVMVGEKGPAQGTMDLKVPDRVLFTGYVKDENLPPLYSGAKAFLYPSLYEGFGLPPLESMASGTPPIVGDRTSLPEVVEDGGLFVNPLKVESIAEGILKIVRNETLSRRLREKGLQRAKQFAWEKTARETWKTLRKTARSDYRS
jgi:glycosyltransferase involved in cell wall biosynthesis